MVEAEALQLLLFDAAEAQDIPEVWRRGEDLGGRENRVGGGRERWDAAAEETWCVLCSFEIARSHATGCCRNVAGDMRSALKPMIGAKRQPPTAEPQRLRTRPTLPQRSRHAMCVAPMMPMSWYCGSHDTMQMDSTGWMRRVVCRRGERCRVGRGAAAGEPGTANAAPTLATPTLAAAALAAAALTASTLGATLPAATLAAATLATASAERPTCLRS